MWAIFTDALYMLSIPPSQRGAIKDAAQNPFIQSWKPRQRTQKDSVSESNLFRTDLYSVAAKHGVSIDTICPSENLKRNLPFWNHIRTIPNSRARTNDQWARCMRVNHKINTVDEILKHSTIPESTNDRRHFNRRNCGCPKCKADRCAGCENPIKCRQAAADLLKILPTEWIPTNSNTCHTSQTPSLILPSHTPDVKLTDADEELAQPQPMTLLTQYDLENLQTFPRETCSSDSPFTEIRVLSNVNRNMTDTTPQAIGPPAPPISAMVTAKCFLPNKADTTLVGHIYYGFNDDRNELFRISINDRHDLPITNPSFTRTKHAALLFTILRLIELTDSNTELVVRSTSYSLINALTNGLQENEDLDWINIENSDLYRCIVARLRVRQALTHFLLLNSNAHIIEISEAYQNLPHKTELSELETLKINTDIPTHLNIRGPKLMYLTQSQIYKLIRLPKTQKVEKRRAAIINLDMIRHETRDEHGHLPSDEEIWKSLLKRELTPQIRAFMWKTIHGAYKIGKYWRNIPEHDRREYCMTCGTEESMSHILTECQSSGQEVIWRLANELLEKRGITWSNPTLGKILACTLPHFKSKKKPLPGKNRLYTIIISESMHLIWKIRCDWTIERKADPAKCYTTEEIETKWLNTINNRLKYDCLMSNHHRYGRKATSRQLVENTWWGTLKNEHLLQDNWTYHTDGVLVSIERRPRGRNR